MILMVAAYPGIRISEDFGTSWDFKFDYLYSYNKSKCPESDDKTFGALQKVLMNSTQQQICQILVSQSATVESVVD